MPATDDPAITVRPAPVHAAGDSTDTGDPPDVTAAELAEDEAVDVEDDDEEVVDEPVDDDSRLAEVDEEADELVAVLDDDRDDRPSLPMTTGDLPRGCCLATECEDPFDAAVVTPSPAPEITGTASTRVVMTVASRPPRRARGPRAREGRGAVRTERSGTAIRAREEERCFTGRDLTGLRHHESLPRRD